MLLGKWVKFEVRLYLDENMAPKEATALRQAGHDVVYVNENNNLRGLTDEQHAQNAQNDNRVLVTKDADFGSLRYKDGLPNTGVLYVTPGAEREGNTEKRLPEIVTAHEADLNQGAFVTVDSDRTRVRELDTLSRDQSQRRSEADKQNGQAQAEPEQETAKTDVTSTEQAQPATTDQPWKHDLGKGVSDLQPPAQDEAKAPAEAKASQGEQTATAGTEAEQSSQSQEAQPSRKDDLGKGVSDIKSPPPASETESETKTR